MKKINFITAKNSAGTVGLVLEHLAISPSWVPVVMLTTRPLPIEGSVQVQDEQHSEACAHTTLQAPWPE